MQINTRKLYRACNQSASVNTVRAKHLLPKLQPPAWVYVSCTESPPASPRSVSYGRFSPSLRVGGKLCSTRSHSISSRSPGSSGREQKKRLGKESVIDFSQVQPADESGTFGSNLSLRVPNGFPVFVLKEKCRNCDSEWPRHGLWEMTSS